MGHGDQRRHRAKRSAPQETLRTISGKQLRAWHLAFVSSRTSSRIANMSKRRTIDRMFPILRDFEDAGSLRELRDDKFVSAIDMRGFN
jgi:hypothetical protein